MNDTSTDPEVQEPSSGGEQDNLYSSGESVEAERRLHLRAFDYWHGLKGEQTYPLFSDLRAEDLAPFKANSLLLEFTKNGGVIRFIGEQVSSLIDEPISVGDYLKDFPESAFARAFLEQFSDEAGRAKAAEFEFVEDEINCRGMMLPFSNDGHLPHFVMIVSNFRRSDAVNDVLADGANSLDDFVRAGQQAADDVVHMDQGGRVSLYHALASALALYEEAINNQTAYQTLLDDVGLKAQARAPFTPALKIVFGKGYDKTRLTEYAAALSFAVRQGETSKSLADFLGNISGGIKGCVQQERAFKRHQNGTPEHGRYQNAIEALRHASGVPQPNFHADEEFLLILARQNADGGVELLGQADVGKTAVDTAIKNMALKIINQKN